MKTRCAHEEQSDLPTAACTPIRGRPTFPLAVALSPDASLIATVVGVVDAPGLWLVWCDLATRAHDGSSWEV